MSYTIFFEKYANRNEEREALKGVEETYKTELKAQIVHHQFLSDLFKSDSNRKAALKHMLLVELYQSLLDGT
jgi:hypothetical protein